MTCARPHRPCHADVAAAVGRGARPGRGAAGGALRAVVTTALVVAAVALAAGCGLSRESMSLPETTATRSRTTAGASATASASVPASASASASAGSGGTDPDVTSAVGEVVDGFPDDVVPVLPGATITLCAVSRTDDGLQIGLSGTTSRTMAQVMAYYRAQLETAGFASDAASPVVAGDDQLTVTLGRSEGAEIVVVTVVDEGEVRSFSVGGTITA